MPPTPQEPDVAVVPIQPSPSIPKELLEEITKCKILSYTIEDGSKPGDNYMSVLYSVSAQLIPENGTETDEETRHYLLKCYPRHPARQLYLNKSNIFHNELSFYTIWAKELVEFQARDCGILKEQVLEPAFPPCTGGKAINFKKCDPNVLTQVFTPLDNFIMMTDLRKTWNFQMADRRKGLEYHHMKLVFKEYASVHALSWAYRQKVDFDLIKKFPFLEIPFNEEDLDMWSKVLETNVTMAENTLDGLLGKGNHLSQSTQDFHSKGKELIEMFIKLPEEGDQVLWKFHRNAPNDLKEMEADEQPWRIICHGDSWCNNLLFKINPETKETEQVILVDFQLTREACPTADLVYTVYTSTTKDFRKNQLEECLQIYHDTFVEVCARLGVDILPGFNMTTLKRRFHRSKVIGYMMALMGLPLMLLEADDAINLDDMDKNTDIEKMFVEAFKSKGGSTYSSRILEVAQELYDEGVI